MQNVDFRNSNFSGNIKFWEFPDEILDMTHTEFRDKYFDGFPVVNIIEVKQSVQGFVNVKLLFYNSFIYADMESLNFEGADFSYTNLSYANLKNTNFKDVKLRNAILGYSDLSGADLSGADLEGAVLEGAVLEGAKLDCMNHPICN